MPGAGTRSNPLRPIDSPSPRIPRLQLRQLRKWRVRLSLIPIRNRRNVIGERLIPTIRLRPPTQSLNRHPQILRKSNRIEDVPPI